MSAKKYREWEGGEKVNEHISTIHCTCIHLGNKSWEFSLCCASGNLIRCVDDVDEQVQENCVKEKTSNFLFIRKSNNCIHMLLKHVHSSESLIL